jgi:starch synthase/alpha-amylase
LLYQLISDYNDENFQVAIVANGEYQRHFHDIVRHHDLGGRVTVCNFDENLSRLGYAAADFMLMPSSFEPCGLPQMVAPIYGTLPVVHKTGGLKDTIQTLDPDKNSGNGFLFENFDTTGFRWAIDRAMEFHRLPVEIRRPQIARIMRESSQHFNIYEKMLRRALVK